MAHLAKLQGQTPLSGLAIWIIPIPVYCREYRYRIERYGYSGQVMSGLASLLNEPRVEEGRIPNGRALDITSYVYIWFRSMDGRVSLTLPR